MGAGDIRAGKAFLELGAKDTMLQRVVDRAERRLRSYAAGVAAIGQKLMLAGATLAAPLIASVKAFTDIGSQLTDMSARTGIGAQGLQVLGQAAEQTGVALEDVEQGVKGMAKFLMTAAGGSDEANQALHRVGLTLGSLRGLTTEQQFIKIGDALSKVADPTVRAALAMKLMGKSGANLLPMFADGAAGIEQMRARMQQLNTLVDDQSVAAADALGDAFGEVWKQVKAGAFNIGAALAPALSDLTAKLQTVLAGVIQFIKENQGLVTAVATVAAGLSVAGAAMLAFSVAIKLVATTLGILSTALGILSTALAFIASGPVGAIVGAMGAVTAALAVAGGAFEGLGNTAKLAIGGISDALAAGDIPLAAEILWASLKIAWQTGVNSLREVWLGFKDWFMGTWEGIAGWLTGILQKSAAGWRLMWADLTGDSAGRKKILEDLRSDLEALDQVAKNDAATRADASQRAMQKADAELRAFKRRRDELNKKAGDGWKWIDWNDLVGQPKAPDFSGAMSGLDFGQTASHNTNGTFSSEMAARLGSVAGNDDMVGKQEITNKQLMAMRRELGKLLSDIKKGLVPVTFNP